MGSLAVRDCVFWRGGYTFFFSLGFTLPGSVWLHGACRKIFDASSFEFFLGFLSGRVFSQGWEAITLMKGLKAASVGLFAFQVPAPKAKLFRQAETMAPVQISLPLFRRAGQFFFVSELDFIVDRPALPSQDTSPPFVICFCFSSD